MDGGGRGTGFCRNGRLPIDRVPLILLLFLARTQRTLLASPGQILPYSRYSPHLHPHQLGVALAAPSFHDRSTLILQRQKPSSKLHLPCFSLLNSPSRTFQSFSLSPTPQGESSYTLQARRFPIHHHVCDTSSDSVGPTPAPIQCSTRRPSRSSIPRY